MMSDLKIEGKIIVIKEVQNVTDTFSKREFVIETDDQYPQKIMMEFTQKNCSKLEAFKVGDNVSVNFNLRGREWTSKKTGEIGYFNTIQAWRIGSLEGDRSTSKVRPETQKDDLPF